MKRTIDILVISDVHLGTYGCRAKELLIYLRSVKPRVLVLNGDIIDIWQLRKSYFPKSHMQVVKKLLKLATQIPVYYITGNHDEALRRYSDMRLGRLQLVDRLVLETDAGTCWFFHGDIFDASMKNAKWLAKLGGFGYDLLVMINNLVNWGLERVGRPRMSFSHKIKASVKRAVKYIGDFEMTAAEIAIEKGYSYVACGHIHQPQIRKVVTTKGDVTYLNSGDWIENMSALEYSNGRWRLYRHEEQVAETSPELVPYVRLAPAI